MPTSDAMLNKCRSNSVAIPLPCQSSATTTANSTCPLSVLGAYRATPISCSILFWSTVATNAISLGKSVCVNLFNAVAESSLIGEKKRRILDRGESDLTKSCSIEASSGRIVRMVKAVPSSSSQEYSKSGGFIVLTEPSGLFQHIQGNNQIDMNKLSINAGWGNIGISRYRIKYA